MKKVSKKVIILVAVLAVAVITAVTVSVVLVTKNNSKKFALSFVTNCDIAYDTLKVAEGEAYSLPTPEREGYSFEGWYLNSDLQGSALTEVTLKEDTTVYAKWEQLYLVTLNLDGGSLSTTKIYLKQGANVYDAVSVLTPTKTGTQFGAWFNGDTELSKNTRMPTTGLTLLAKYKVAYSVKVYKQNLTMDGYDESVETLYEYLGNTVTYDEKFAGFTEVSKEDTIKSINVSETDNLIKVYFDRSKITIYFNPNYPDGSTAEMGSVETYYGLETEIPENYYYQCQGYYLEGWSTSYNGDIQYNSNYIDRVLYNGSVTALDKVTAERTMTLYAVWKKGNIDMFGGTDTIFADSENGIAYLLRGGVFFKGEFYPEDNTFSFVYTVGGRTGLSGKINNNGTFVYEDGDRSKYTSSLFQVGTGVNENITLHFGLLNDVEYVDSTEATKTSAGEYTINEDGEFIITFSSGELNGQTLTVQIGVTDNSQNVFKIRNDEEYQMGEIVRFGVNNGSVGTFSYYQIILTGYGIAYYNNAGTTAGYYYTKEGDVITLLNSSGKVYGTLVLKEIDGKLGYFVYNKALDVVIENLDGSTLTLDGMCNYTYKDDNKEFSGYYTATSSVFGGYIINANNQDGTVKYLVTYTTDEVIESVEQEDGTVVDETHTVTTYKFQQKLSSYAEYYYKDESGYYYAPLFALDETVEGVATLYGYTAKKTYEKVSQGTYVLDENTGLFTYTVESYVEEQPDVSTALFDLSVVKKVIFAIDTQNTSYNITYWYLVELEDGTITTYNTTYTSQDGSKLVIVQGMAVYEGQGDLVTGVYAENSDGTLSAVSTSEDVIYMEVNHEDKTFVVLQYAPYYAYEYTQYGQRNAKTYIYFDGKGKATYHKTETTEEDGEEVETNYEVAGTVTKTNTQTYFGVSISLFKSNEDDLEFYFINLYTSSDVFFAKYNYNPVDGKCDGKYYTTEGYGSLRLDGFGYNAEYIDVLGNSYTGVYVVSDENNQITIATDVKTVLCDLVDDSFTVKGDERGTYIVFDNQMLPGIYLYFNGYSNAEVFSYEIPEGETEYSRVDIDKNATYTINDDIVTVKYTDNGVEKQYVGVFSTFTYSSYVYNTFEVLRGESVVNTYINGSDWTVLVTDQIGNATRYKKDGTAEKGTYKLITETMLYYINSAYTDACLYNYDVETRKLTPCNNSENNQYFTEDLDTLLFRKYGFVEKNGVSEAYYYEVDENDIVWLYYYEEKAVNANQYGFVKIEFGKFDDTVIFDGATYYKNEGFDLRFSRDTDNQDLYKLNGKAFTDLKFQPSGRKNYAVSATVLIDGEITDCYVYTDNEGKMFLMLEDSEKEGYYSFDLSITYNGSSNSVYAINGMNHYIEYESYTFIQNYVMFYMYFGSAYANMLQNTIGTMSLVDQYNQNGELDNSYISLQWGEVVVSLLVDSQGNKFDQTKFNQEDYLLVDKSYVITKTMGDGYTYKLRLTPTAYYGFPCFAFSFTRVQYFDVECEGVNLKVMSEIVVLSETTSTGAYTDVKVFDQNGDEIPYTQAYIYDGSIYYIVREDSVIGEGEEAKHIAKSTYYVITFKEVTNEGLEEDEETSNNSAPIFESASVVIRNNTCYYTEDNSTFIEVCNNTVYAVVTQKVSSSGTVQYTTVLVNQSSYDTETGVYTITTIYGVTYTATIDENKVLTLQKVVVEE